MYKVMIVDDEIVALNFVKQIIEKKTPEFRVVYAAQNGKNALENIEIYMPDIIISDIRMPVMDGIALVEQVSIQYPEIYCILITGFQEFEYAQKALRYGVMEYLLKPVKPKELASTMKKLREKLDMLYYKKRISLFNEIVKGNKTVNEVDLKRYFGKGKYHAIFIRQKGLPKRFASENGIPVYSLADEQLFIYGRDEKEALYLIPQNYLIDKDIRALAKHLIQGKDEYSTCLFSESTFNIIELSNIVHRFYKQLNVSTIIGKSQIIEINDNKQVIPIIAKEENTLIEKIEYLIKCKDVVRAIEIINQLFNLWEKANVTQIYMEKQVNYILFKFYNTFDQKEPYSDIVFSIEDAFLDANDLSQLYEMIIQTISDMELGESPYKMIDEKESLFHEILCYLEDHMNEDISMSMVCKHFGVSQTSLSRLFRKNKEGSFSNYLTTLRINKAKIMLTDEPEVFIKDIAYRVGYKDQFYFSRIFRSVVGMSPTEYIDNKR